MRTDDSETLNAGDVNDRIFGNELIALISLMVIEKLYSWII